MNTIFHIIEVLTIIFALGVVLSKNIFHSAIFLALALVGIAGVFLCLDAEFLAVIQVLIYVGAIAVIFLFAIMLTGRIQDLTVKLFNSQVVGSAITAIAFFCLFIFIIWMNPWRTSVEHPQILSLQQLGKALMTTYVLPFEVISIILLLALIGAIVIGKVKKE